MVPGIENTQVGKAVKVNGETLTFSDQFQCKVTHPLGSASGLKPRRRCEL